MQKRKKQESLTLRLNKKNNHNKKRYLQYLQRGEFNITKRKRKDNRKTKFRRAHRPHGLVTRARV